MHKRGIKYKGIFLTVFNKIKKQAKERDIYFDISIEYIGDLFEQQKGKCALSGLDLTLKKHTKDKTQTASLDRKDNTKGYLIGNLQWVHKDLNRLKNTFTQEKFVELCCMVSDHIETKKQVVKILELLKNK